MVPPPQTAHLAQTLGDAGRTAVTVSEDLLDGLAVLGDRATQDAVDSFVDEAVDLLREIVAATHELTLGIAGGTTTPPSAAAEDTTTQRESRR